MKKTFNRFLIALVIASFCAFPLVGRIGEVQAQDSFPPTLEPVLSADGLTLAYGGSTLMVVVDPDQARQGIQVAREPEVQAAIEAAVADPDATSAAFSITYVAAGGKDPWNATCLAFPAAAKTAFNAAAAIWTSTLQSSVPIRISACWSNLGSPSILGYSGGAPLHRDFTGAPKTHTWYEGSLANALHGSDLDAAAYDDYITYNSGFSWYFGTNGVVPVGQYDLVTVAAHEIAHGLNFSGSASYSGGTGSYGYGGYPNIYDTFMENASGTKLTSYTTPSTALGTLLTSGSLWFNGTNSKAANGATRVKMYAPSSWSGGSSYSHLDYTTFAGTANSMMVYAVSSGASQHNPGVVTKGLLKDLGWVLASGTPTTIPTPQSPSGTISDTTPTFTWTKITGATQYRFQVVKGTTIVYTKIVPSSACGTSTCSSTPTTTLSYAAYKWRVQAYVSGAWKTYSASKSFTITNIPTPNSPSGTIYDTTPTFKWTRISGATQYHFAVYKGTTLKYKKTVATSACGSTTCSNTPTTVLSTGAYTWKVRAYVGGAWRAYSAYKSFTVATSTAFDSEFTSNASGWTPLNGTWTVGSGYYQTLGLTDKFVSSKHSNSYNVLTYEVKLSRNDNSKYSYGVFFNGAPSPITSDGWWHNGYAFLIADGGSSSSAFSIWRFDGGVSTPLLGWTDYSGLSTGWNTLKVTYNSSTKYVQFYINGSRVASGTLTTYTSGQVGLGYYRVSSSAKLYVDYAKLSLTAPSSIVAGDGIVIDDAIDMGVIGDPAMMSP